MASALQRMAHIWNGPHLIWELRRALTSVVRRLGSELSVRVGRTRTITITIIITTIIMP